MSARRQPSSTSLSKFARSQSTEFNNRSLDFCNAFWGLGDVGVDVLFARMRGATRTMEELRNFWKERAMIEEQYAKRLTSLAKYTLGRDEIGELRGSLDILRLETERQASFHLNVAQQIKTDLEGQANVFLNKQLHHKRTYQAAIEKEFKTKQTQEGYVNKAREKYEADCVKINSYTAQSTLMQGKDLDKIQLKLERAQQTVHANERDFANFSRALQDTVVKWEQDWKMFCDSCQDLEEDRMEFMKDNMWAYANSVSTVCVQDDESCEKLRLSLEQLEPEKDMENFVRDYGTGNSIPDPPTFVNYANPDAVPPSSQRPSTRPSNFHRSSQRARPPPPAASPPPQDDGPPVDNTGIGSGQRRGTFDSGNTPDVQQGRSQSRTSTRQPSQPPAAHTHNGGNGSISSLNGLGLHASPQQMSPNTAMRAPDANAEPIDPRHQAMLKIGDNAYPVDLTNDPQARPSQMQNGRPGTAGGGASRVGQQDDPLAQQMEQLRNGASSVNSMRKGAYQQQPGPSAPQQQQQQPPNGPTPSDKLSPPPGSRGGGAPNRDYRRSAEFVVGSLPPGIIPSSRPASPAAGAPTANFMKPPPQADMTDVQNVVADYQQSFPGERKSVSRPGSRASYNQPPPQGSGPLGRPLSSDGGQQQQSGFGVQRSVSPQPYPQRGASPSVPYQQQQQQPPQQQQLPPLQQASSVNRRNSYRVPGPGSTPGGSSAAVASAVSPSSVSSLSTRSNSISVPQVAPHQQRPTSPSNSVGIALSADGGVALDVMRDRYQQQQQQQQQQIPPQNQQPPSSLGYRGPAPQQPQQVPPQQQQHQGRSTSYNIPPQTQPPYGAPPPAPSGYPPSYPQQAPQQQQVPLAMQPNQPQPTGYVNQQQQQRPPYSQQPPPQQQLYQPQQYDYAQQQQQAPQPPPPHQPQQQQQPGGMVQRNPSMNQGPPGGGYYGNGNQGYAPADQQQALGGGGYGQPQQVQSAYGAQRGIGVPPSATGVQRQPSPQPPQAAPGGQVPPPTGQYTEDGRGVLFYVKALYDYTAVIDEEFDFQTGDIIAVTDTPEDGWWSGELLDEARRQPGRHVFPSNFVCLF